MIVAQGSDVEIKATVTKTRWYQHLTESAPVMGFYDVKNARLCNVWEGQGLTHTEPALDDEDFERYVKSFVPLMLPARDVLWVLGGRTEANRMKLQRILARNGLTFRVFHLCYNTRQMQQCGHFKRQRGIAGSRSHELMFLCLGGGACPKTLPRKGCTLTEARQFSTKSFAKCPCCRTRAMPWFPVTFGRRASPQ